RTASSATAITTVHSVPATRAPISMTPSRSIPAAARTPTRPAARRSIPTTTPASSPPSAATARRAAGNTCSRRPLPDRLVRAVVALGLAVAGAASAAAPAVWVPPAETRCDLEGWTTDTDPEGLNVRAAPSARAAVVGTLPAYDAG